MIINQFVLDKKINEISLNTRLPTGLKKEQILRFQEGDIYKVCYYNGFNKMAEITIKDRSYLKLSLKSDSGIDLTLNTFGLSFTNGVWTFGTDLYIYGNGIIRSNFNNQDGLAIQFNRDTIGNCYQFEVIKIK